MGCSRMTTVLFFGSGASRGSLDCTPEAPPVGPALFTELRKRGGVFATISEDMAAAFNRRFEEGMARFIEERPMDRPAFLREMALYFLQFRPGPRNLYREVIRRAKASRRRTVYSTINYDILIELSAESLGFGWSIVVPREHPMAIPVLKLHGSCNFMPDLKGLILRGTKVGSSTSVYEGDIVAMLPQNAEQFLRTEDVMGPVLAMYEERKRVVYAPAKIQEIQAIWKRELAEARRIYVIGVAVNLSDTHIWGPLAQTQASVGYVGLESDVAVFEDWAAKNREGPSEIVSLGFENAVSSLLFE